MFGLLVGVVALGAVACGDDAAAPADTAVVTVADLQGNAYTATSATQIALPASSSLTLTFLATSLGVTGGCNTMTGGWQVMAGNRLLVSQLAQTQKACADDLMALDASVTQLLGSQPVVALSGAQMTLTSGSTSITFNRAAPGADVSLEGPTWTVTSTFDKNGTTTVNAPKPATLAFSGGNVAVFAGCNTGSATYTSTDTTIEVGPLALTRMACGEAETTLETAVTTALTGTVTYAIDGGGVLTLTNADGAGLTATAAA
jgi:heat shock protein HslJ